MTIEELAGLLIDANVEDWKLVYSSRIVDGTWSDREKLKEVVTQKLKKITESEKKQTEFHVGDIVRWKCWIFELKAIYLDSDGTKKYKTCWEECNKRWVPASELELIERRK
jgi:hypothetical protein